MINIYGYIRGLHGLRRRRRLLKLVRRLLALLKLREGLDELDCQRGGGTISMRAPFPASGTISSLDHSLSRPALTCILA